MKKTIPHASRGAAEIAEKGAWHKTPRPPRLRVIGFIGNQEWGMIFCACDPDMKIPAFALLSQTRLAASLLRNLATALSQDTAKTS
jgi:hypothetical protein